MRFLVFALLLTTTVTAPAAEFDDAIGGYLQKHCIACHNAKRAEGDFRIDSLSQDVGREDTSLWAEVRERISSGEMPPEDAPNRPSADAGAAVVEWLTEQIKAGESARLAQRSEVSFHRLSREEYVNTIYDLLGVHFDATDPGGFNDDPDWRGFERIGSVLSLSPSHIEKYFLAAETVLDEAYPAKPPEVVTIMKEAAPTRSIAEPYRSRLEAEGLLDKVRYDLWPQDKHRNTNPGRLKSPGVYELRMQLSGLKPKDGRAPRLKIYSEKLDRVLFAKDIVAAEDKPTTITFQTHLPATSNAQITVFNDTPGPSNLPRSGRHGRKPFVSIANGRIPWQLKLTDEEGNALYPFLILDWAEWKGPIVTDREQQLRDQYMAANNGDWDQVREGLSRLARRAFRRPLKEGEVEKYVKIAQTETEAGADFRSAVKTGMLAILCSKSFLFLEEGSPKDGRNTLTDHELANRLSYFLWSTMPDEELFSLADNGTLHQPEVLAGQVERMLADSKSKRFSESFTRQWLQLRKVGMFPPDAKLYPDYDAHLEDSMIGETTAFFQEVLTANLSLKEFLQSDWTMLNSRLAEFYGVDCNGDDAFQRVALKPENRRGGLLTQAAILSLTSDGQRQRPVHRGVWLSESIFGKTPPPPPANVEAIEPNPVNEPKATLRMKLAAHKANASCASCHRKIDPLGLAFENYDAIGRWRTHERVNQGTGQDPEVDASGELPDGRSFAHAEEFKSLLLNDIDAFNTAFIEKLATYAMRRSLTFEDHDKLAAIAKESKAADYRLKAIVQALVLSDLFQSR